MRVLVCSLEPPLPPYNGLRLPLAALLDRLRKAHDVRLVCLAGSAAELRLAESQGVRAVPAPTPSLSAKLLAVLRSVLYGRPVWGDRTARLVAPALIEEIEQFDPDIVHVFSGRLDVRSVLGPRPTVLTALDAWHLNVLAQAGRAHGVRRRVLDAQLRRVRSFEAREYPRYSAVVVVSDEDRAALAALDPDLRPIVIPNGVDADSYAPAMPVSYRDRERELIVLHGAMDYPPNVAAAEVLVESVLPIVHRSVPNATVALVGRNPTKAVRLLARDGVDVTGEVEDVRPWLWRAAAYACPMVSGTGVKNKLLEAMAAGVPCVSSPLGIQGLRVRRGVDLLVAADEATFAASIVRLLTEPVFAASIAETGRRRVSERHSWDEVANCYEELYGALRLQPHRRRAIASQRTEPHR